MSTRHDQDPGKYYNPDSNQPSSPDALVDGMMKDTYNVSEAIVQKTRDESVAEAEREHHSLWNKTKIKVGAIVVGLALAAGGGATVAALSHESTEPKSEPAVTGPEVPGQPNTANPGASEQPPLVPSSSIEMPNQKFNHLTTKNFPFLMQEGEEFKELKGEDALQADIELRAEDFKGDKITGLASAGFNRMNKWMSSAANKQTTIEYKDLQSADGKSGAKIVAKKFYDPVFAKALTTNPSFAEEMGTLHETYIGEYERTGGKYTGGFRQEKLITYIEARDTISFHVMSEYKSNQENAGGDGTVGRLIEFEKVLNDRGDEVWKILNYDQSSFAN